MAEETAVVQDRAAEMWDRAHAQGHRCGYMDAVAEIWEYGKDIPSADPRYRVLVDVAQFLRERRDRALEH